MTNSVNLIDVQRQIETLRKQAEALRASELPKVVGRIKEAIEVYGITAEDLGFGSAAGRAVPVGKADRLGRTGSVGATRPARYSDGNGRSWGGMGPRPKWLREALAAGRTLEEFAV
jgi:DNA-binding protein H-NS